jgi:hypothetical protein
MSITITPSLNPLLINTATGLQINFNLTDTISKTDYFQVIFPTDTIFTYSAISSNLQIASVTYNSSNYTLSIRQSSAAPSRVAGTSCFVLFRTYTSPPSTKTTSPIYLTILTSAGYSKM